MREGGACARLDPTRAALRDLFARHERAAFAFSGGRDSLVLLDLLRPWRDRVTVLWVNTGLMFPHMIGFVRRAVEGWRFVELASDVEGHIRAFGLPSGIVPTAHTLAGRYPPRAPQIQAWQWCCTVNRSQPLIDYLRDHPELTVMLHGQRQEDRVPKGGSSVPGVSAEWQAPLWEWSTEAVMAYIAQHRIELPEQYALGAPHSLECIVCTFVPDRGRLAYMRQRYPDHARLVEDAVRRIRTAVTEAIDSEFGISAPNTACEPLLPRPAALDASAAAH